MNVNVSARQLARIDFAAFVDQTLETAEISPVALTLELGPGCADYLDSTFALRDLGVNLAIEDFGQGTTLEDVRRLPVSALKLHSSFVSLAGGPPEDVSFAESLLAIARARNLTTTGKGVETRDQARRLAALGCDLAQGYPLQQAARPRGHRHVARPWPRLVSRCRPAREVGLGRSSRPIGAASLRSPPTIRTNVAQASAAGALLPTASTWHDPRARTTKPSERGARATWITTRIISGGGGGAAASSRVPSCSCSCGSALPALPAPAARRRSFSTPPSGRGERRFTRPPAGSLHTASPHRRPSSGTLTTRRMS